MITKMLTNESKTVTGAAIIIGLATLGSRIIGIVRDRLFAHYFGAGPMMDAYYASFKIPDLIYNLLIVGALTAGFIPTFTKLLDKDPSRKSAWRLANNVLTIIAVALAIISGLGALFAPHLTTLLFPGFPNATTELAVLFTRIMFISPLLLGISMVLGGILQSLRQFFIYSLAPIFYNLGIIIGAVALVPLLGPTGLAWGVVLGALLHMLVQCYGTYSNGWRWRFTFDLSDASTRTIGALMLPRTFGLAAHHINNIIITSFASFLSIGSVSVYNFANNLQAVPTGLVAIPFALAVFPLLSEMDLPKDNQAFLEKIISTARYILFLIVPIIIILLLLRAQIVRLILGSGAFDWTATIATANTLAFFAIGLIGQALIPLLARAFYAMTGHLVLSTLHTNDAATAIPRLLDMEVPAFLIASTVTVIIAQRLVRKLCPSCLTSFNLTPAELKDLTGSLNLAQFEADLKKAGLLSDRYKGLQDVTFYRGKGCNQCGNEGYRGRLGIYEALEMTPKIQELVMKRATSDEIIKAARSEGMLMMIEDGFLKAQTGVTSLEEVLRVTTE
jgi:putative peptidoglycan lipid II flippase